MKIVALIPARAGSKRLPGKNVRLLKGKPLVSYTFEAALRCPLITQTVTTTDDDRIKALAKSYAVTVLDRPENLCSDQASSEDVVTHALQTLADNGKSFDLFVFLQPTSPLRTAEHITSCLSKIIDTKSSSSISVTKVHPHPRYFFVEKDGLIQRLSLKNGLEETPIFRPNGAIYAAFVSRFMKERKFLIAPCLPFEMSESESLDIDYLTDFIACEALLSQSL